MGQRRKKPHRRTVEGFGGVKIVLLNLEPSFWSDLYHGLLTIAWPKFWLIISSGYVQSFLLLWGTIVTFSKPIYKRRRID